MFRFPTVRRVFAIAALAAAAFSVDALRKNPFGAVAAQAVSAPLYVYGIGPQGLGYYLAPGSQAPAAAPRLAVPPRAPSPAPAAARSVGPGARNWATGNRVPSHRPWLRSRS